jgi:hypothetical protein
VLFRSFSGIGSGGTGLKRAVKNSHSERYILEGDKELGVSTTDIVRSGKTI